MERELELELPDRYVDVSLLAAQENRRVFRCREAVTGESIALKCLLPTGVAVRDDAQAEAFRAEYLRLEAIDHPNWVRPGRFFALPAGGCLFELELSSGHPLLDVAWRGWCPEVAEIARQILSGLHALHVLGVAHLDLKPDQVLVGGGSSGARASAPEGSGGASDPLQVHLLDLGLSHGFGTSIPPTGTAGYIAPELMGREAQWDGRVDLYAFGVLLHQLLWNRHPFPGAAAGDILRAQLEGVDLSAEYRRGEIPRPLVSLVSELLEVDPELRPRDVTEVWSRLRDVRAAQDWPPEPNRLTGARGFPFVGRVEEVKTFADWWAGVSRASTSTHGTPTFAIQAEPHLGLGRLRRRLVAVAQSQGGVTLPAEETDTETPLMVGGRRVAVAVSTAPSTLVVESTVRLPADREGDSVRLRLGCDEESKLVEMAAARGVVSRALAEYLVRLAFGREELLWHLIEIVPEEVRIHPWRDGVGLERTVSRHDPPAVLLDWLRAGLESLDSGHRHRWCVHALVAGARSFRWTYPCVVLPGFETEMDMPEPLGRWVCRAASSTDIERAWRAAISLTSNEVERSILCTVAGRVRDENLVRALETLEAEGYFETALTLFIESSRTVEFEDLVPALPVFLHVLFIARPASDGCTIPRERAVELDSRVEGGSVLESLSLAAEGQRAEALRVLLPEPPTLYSAREIWRRLRTMLSPDAASREGPADEAATDEGPARVDVRLWNEVRNLESAPAAEVLRVLERLESTPELPESHLWRMVFWAGTMAYGKNLFEPAERVFRHALECDRRWSNGRMAPTIYVNLGGLLFESGRLAEVEPVLRAVAEDARLSGVRGLLSLSLSNLCVVACEMGRIEEGIRHADSARAIGRDRSGFLFCWVQVGWIDEVLDATEGLDADSSDDDVVLSRCSRGVALLARRPSDGRALLRELTEAFRGSDSTSDLLETLVGWLFMELDLGHVAEASTLGRALEPLVERGSHLDRIKCRLALAQLEIESDGPGAATPTFQQSLARIGASIEQSGLGYYRWRVSWLSSRSLRASGDLGPAGEARETARRQLLSLVAPLADRRHEARFLALPACARFLAEIA